MDLIKIDFWTSHHQFYIVDKSSPFRADSDDFWSAQASEDKLAIEGGILGVGTECYGHVNGDIHTLDTAPTEEDLSTYDHVVEGSLILPSGILQVFACLDKIPIIELELPPVTYRVRVYSSNLSSVDGDSGDDYYRVRIWPEVYVQRRVLRR